MTINCPLPTVLVALLSSFAPIGAHAAEELAISNRHLSAIFDQGAGVLTILSKDTDTTFIRDKLSSREPSSARVVEIEHAVFGAGEAIELTYANGRVDQIAAYEDVEFLFLRPTLANTSDRTINLKEVDLLDTALSLGKPVGSLKALGTAGLTAVDGQTGSYMFLALADPATNHGVVGAWLSSDRGSGIVFSGKQQDQATLRARIDYGRLRIAPGEQAEGETFVIGHFKDARRGLEEYADLVAQNYGIKLRPQPAGYCTWYSNPHGGACDQERIIEIAKTAAQELKPYGFDLVQIDDGWQDGKERNGPAKVFERVKPEGQYSDGMKPVADQITDLGLTAGIWWMPFAGDRRAPYFADKQPWFTKKADGTPYHTPWGGTALDLTNPRVRDFVGFLSNRMANEWGYKYFKMDGLWMGTSTKQAYINNGYREDDELGVPGVHDPNITPIEAYRLGLKQVRDSAGDDVFFLGCNVSQNMRSFGATYGLVDAMRVGPDNGAKWDRLVRGPWHSSNRYFLHRRVWYNDPDPLYIRASVPLHHARLICSWIAVSGHLSVCSEWLPELPEERVDMLRRTLPSHDAFARPVDIFENPLAKIWLLQDDRSGVLRNVIGLYNWSDKQSERIDYDLAKLGLDPTKQYVGFDYWSNEFLSPFTAKLAAELEPATCRVLALRELTDHPVLVSTSRHITQGIVDVVHEKWNRQERTLSGTSRLVGGDPYELRFALPASSTSWKLASFEVASDTVTVVSETQKGSFLRVGLSTEQSREIEWTAHFSPE
ncbi:MAG: alpha-galactosidase [Lacipirellulaceae bacterium]